MFPGRPTAAGITPWRGALATLSLAFALLSTGDAMADDAPCLADIRTAIETRANLWSETERRFAWIDDLIAGDPPRPIPTSPPATYFGVDASTPRGHLVITDAQGKRVSAEALYPFDPSGREDVAHQDRVVTDLCRRGFRPLTYLAKVTVMGGLSRLTDPDLFVRADRGALEVAPGTGRRPARMTSLTRFPVRSWLQDENYELAFVDPRTIVVRYWFGARCDSSNGCGYSGRETRLVRLPWAAKRGVRPTRVSGATALLANLQFAREFDKTYALSGAADDVIVCTSAKDQDASDTCVALDTVTGRIAPATASDGLVEAPPAYVLFERRYSRASSVRIRLPPYGGGGTEVAIQPQMAEGIVERVWFDDAGRIVVQERVGDDWPVHWVADARTGSRRLWVGGKVPVPRGCRSKACEIALDPRRHAIADTGGREIVIQDMVTGVSEALPIDDDATCPGCGTSGWNSGKAYDGILTRTGRGDLVLFDLEPDDSSGPRQAGPRASVLDMRTGRALRIWELLP